MNVQWQEAHEQTRNENYEWMTCKVRAKRIQRAYPQPTPITVYSKHYSITRINKLNESWWQQWKVRQTISHRHRLWKFGNDLISRSCASTKIHFSRLTFESCRSHCWQYIWKIYFNIMAWHGRVRIALCALCDYLDCFVNFRRCTERRGKERGRVGGRQSTHKVAKDNKMK